MLVSISVSVQFQFPDVLGGKRRRSRHLALPLTNTGRPRDLCSVSLSATFSNAFFSCRSVGNGVEASLFFTQMYVTVNETHRMERGAASQGAELKSKRKLSSFWAGWILLQL
jgi:hypothetical protein